MTTREEVEELVARLRDETRDDPSQMAFDIHEAADMLEKLLSENERLHQVCRDTYEVWAGSEGIPFPETCAEAYAIGLVEKMRDEVKNGLKAT